MSATRIGIGLTPEAGGHSPCPSHALACGSDEPRHRRAEVEIAENSLGIDAVLLAALDAEAKAFYERFRFLPPMDNKMRLGHLGFKTHSD